MNAQLPTGVVTFLAARLATPTVSEWQHRGKGDLDGAPTVEGTM